MSSHSFGFEKLCFDLAYDMGEFAEMLHKASIDGVESPIERLFATALWMAVDGYNRSIDLRCWFSTGERWIDPVEEKYLRIRTQWVIFDNWPVDFAFGLRRGDLVNKIVVECDGHDFHDGTKEQAARDRSRDRRLQELGFTALRFTGSEIHRNPWGCAQEAFRALVKDLPWSEDRS